MSENLKDILSNLNPEVDQETLLLYLQGKLSDDQRHELEKQMLQDEFDTDALEGLEKVENKQNLDLIAAQLNKELHQKTKKKQNDRRKRPIDFASWILISTVLLLLLIVIAYFIIYKLSAR